MAKKKVDQVAEFVRKNPDLSLAQVAKKAKCSVSTVSAAKRSMKGSPKKPESPPQVDGVVDQLRRENKKLRAIIALLLSP